MSESENESILVKTYVSTSPTSLQLSLPNYHLASVSQQGMESYFEVGSSSTYLSKENLVSAQPLWIYIYEELSNRI